MYTFVCVCVCKKEVHPTDSAGGSVPALQWLNRWKQGGDQSDEEVESTSQWSRRHDTFLFYFLVRFFSFCVFFLLFLFLHAAAFSLLISVLHIMWCIWRQRSIGMQDPSMGCSLFPICSHSHLVAYGQLVTTPWIHFWRHFCSAWAYQSVTISQCWPCV